MSRRNTQAREILAEALGVAQDAVGPDTRLGVAPEWDSLAHMRLILALEKQLGAALPATAILSVAGLDDVVALLEPARQPD